MNEAGRAERVLIIGLGNPVLRDDAVGVRLARDFRRRWEGGRATDTRCGGAPSGVVRSRHALKRGAPPDRAPTDRTNDLHFIEECSVGGLALVEQLVGYERVVALDSIRTRDGRPGDWYSFTAAALRPTMNLGGVHDANFATALELGRRTGLALPPDDRIVIFAVEIEDNLTFDERMSDALEDSYPRYSEEIFAEIERVVGG